MIQIPFEEIVNKIREKTGLSEEEINKKINEKLEQLSGLISKEGAAHIVANELGVKLFNLSGKLKVKDIFVGMRSVEVVGRVERIFGVVEFDMKSGGKGKVASMIIGDETGRIRVVAWGGLADEVDRLKEGDIVKVVRGYVKDNQGRKEIHLNNNSELIVNPEGESVEEIKSLYERKKIIDLKENDYAEVLAYIVQMLDLNFFEICPECKRKLLREGEKNICVVHKEVDPDYSYVLNLFIDDGSDNIRAVCFSKQIEKLFNMKNEEILDMMTNKEKFKELREKFLGVQKIFVGNVRRNKFFDRLEFVVEDIKEADPEEELKRLENAA